MTYDAGEPFNCDECGEEQLNRLGSFKIVNRATKEEFFVCSKCIKKYNVKKAN